MANRLRSPISSFFLRSNDDQLERSQVRADAATRRRAIGILNPPADPVDPCLSREQIIDLFRNCIKLASENKINQKNSWELKLIDHLSEIITPEAEGEVETNFHKASCTLEAGAKIYGLRVDSLHADAYKVLCGMNCAMVEDDQAGMWEIDKVGRRRSASEPKKESEKKISFLSTLESSFEPLNLKKIGLAFAVDPLYHQTSAQFDKGGARGLLLNNLGVYAGCRVIFDSLEVPGHVTACLMQKISDTIDISFAIESIEEMVMNIHAKNVISPTLEEIKCHFNEDNQRVSEKIGIGKKFNVRAESVGAYEVEADNRSFGDHERRSINHNMESSGFSESFSFDCTSQNHHEEDDPCTSSEADVDQTVENVATFLFQGLGFSSTQNTWAGPDHWKFHRQKGPENVLAAKSGPAVVSRKPKNKKLAELEINFKGSADRAMLGVFDPPKSRKSLQLPMDRVPCSNTLPEDCHYQPENLVKLFLLPDVLCLGNRSKRVSAESSLHQQKNFNDALPSWDNESVLGGEFADYNFHGMEDADKLTSEPRKVNKIEVQYDKISKQVDVQALKDMLWDRLKGSVEVPETVHKEAISFKYILATFQTYAAAASKDISPHLCFICLLHLANENGLIIQGCSSLDDLRIHLPPRVYMVELCSSDHDTEMVAVFLLIKRLILTILEFELGYLPPYFKGVPLKHLPLDQCLVGFIS